MQVSVLCTIGNIFSFFVSPRPHPLTVDTDHLGTTLIQGSICYVSEGIVTCSSHDGTSTPEPSQLVVLAANITWFGSGVGHPCAAGEVGPLHHQGESESKLIEVIPVLLPGTGEEAACDTVTEMRGEVMSAGWGLGGDDVLRKIPLLLKRNAGKGFSVLQCLDVIV